MKRDRKVTSTKKVAYYIYRFVLCCTFVVLGWANLLYINEGIRLPLLVLLGIFVFGIIIFILHFRYRHQVMALLKTKFPRVNVDNFLKICFIIAIIIGIFSRVGFVFINKAYSPAEPLSDTGIHWEVARGLADNQPMQGDTAIYEAFFPHLMAYSITLSLFMRIVGQNVFAIVISNLIFDLISVVCIYLFLHSWKNKRTAIIGSIIWLINPINILYCGVGMPMIITNTCILLTILLSYYVYQSYQRKDKRALYLLSCLLGLTIALGNSFRPIFTIITIAIIIIFLCYLSSHIKDGSRRIIPATLAVVLLLLCSFMGTKLIDVGYQHINPYHIPGGTGVGWNFMLGANYESSGRWNRADSAWFGELVYGEETTPDLVNIQKSFFKAGIDRYLAMSPSQFINHFLHKTRVLFIDQSDTIAWPFGEAYNVDTRNTMYQVLHSIGIALFAVLLCLAFKFIVVNIQSDSKIDYVLFFLCLCFCGLVAASLLVEVMWRYVLQSMIIVVILASCAIGRIIAKKGLQS